MVTTQPYIYRPVTGMPSKAPVRFTVPAHGLVDGWKAAVSGLVGPTELNAKNTPPIVGADPRTSDFQEVSVIDVDTIEFNELNAIEYDDYVSGGVLQYLSPVSLANTTARMQIRATMDGPVELELTTENGGIVVSDSAHIIELVFEVADTVGLLMETGEGVWDIELVSGNEVWRSDGGTVVCTPEVTREDP